MSRFGWLPELPDARDHLFLPQIRRAPLLPHKVDLRPLCPPVQDQGQLGSCVGNAIAAMVDFVSGKQKEPFFTPSRLFIYYNARVYAGLQDSDAGAFIRDGMKSVKEFGAPPEPEWPYVESAVANQPADVAYVSAKKHEAIVYQSLDNTNLTELKSCIAEGFPFVFGFTVPTSFLSDAMARTGTMRMPNWKKERVEGGHAVTAVGYTGSYLIIRNSWGTAWGRAGHFMMPMDYLTSDMCDDFWTLRVME